MATVNRATIVKLHLILAAFIFPVALMFLVTGGLYTWGIKGSYESSVHEIALRAPLTADLPELQSLVQDELQKLGVSAPSGGAGIKRGGTSFTLEWTGAARDVVLEPTANPLVAKLTIKDTTWYRNFVQLHKAKGGQLFKVYAAALAIALFVILLSGFIVAWQVPKFRKLAVLATTAGIATFILMFSSS
ncbi:MAG: hypothetical protein V2J12_00885 [Gammaproteobacteria bacterium]|jgi:hypothetical protein|nr:hypothetical protein [Gammaproteobacteria bacterium]